MDKIYQCRYYGTNLDNEELNPKSYPLEFTADILKTNIMPLFNSQGVTRLEIQGDPGVKFWIGIDGRPALGPLFLGITGVYSLDLKVDQKLTDLHFDEASVDNVDQCWTMDVNNNTDRNAYLIVTVTY
jgi:hypothetical protein